MQGLKNAGITQAGMTSISSLVYQDECMYLVMNLFSDVFSLYLIEIYHDLQQKVI